MNRRKLFSFLALAPVGVAMAKEEVVAKDADVPVKVTPGEKCIHCGCPQHHMEHHSYQAEKVCSWCRLPWVGKKWEPNA